MESIEGEENQACLNGLGLQSGEQVRLQYVAFRLLGGQAKKGLLVFTNDNMIFMQQEGWRSKNYGQAIRVPIESISGIVAGGSMEISVGVNGITEHHIFLTFWNDSGRIEREQVRAEIESVLKEVREERKRLARQALSQGTVPAMVFCRFCGLKNKSSEPKCSSCGAALD